MTEQPGAIDYSFSHPNLANLPASVQGVCRYLRGGPVKQLDRGEVDAIHHFGLWLLLNDETEPTRPQGGTTFGLADGARAGDAARALGAPTNVIIHPSIDFDVVSDKQLETVLDYLRGFRIGSGYPQGGYMESGVLDAAGNAGLLSTGKGWQPLAWSHGNISDRAALWQYLNGQPMAGGIVDLNRVIDVNALGVWRPNERTEVDYVTEDPRGGWWAIAPGLASKTGLNSMDLVNRMIAGGSVNLSGTMDAAQLDAITQIGVPSPDAVFVAQHVDATTAAVNAIPHNGSGGGALDLAGTFRLTNTPPA